QRFLASPSPAAISANTPTAPAPLGREGCEGCKGRLRCAVDMSTTVPSSWLTLVENEISGLVRSFGSLEE
ncbi:hypothetical protein O988_08562, partial [Pseudogymnoascus sp. VKM F-3808]